MEQRLGQAGHSVAYAEHKEEAAPGLLDELLSAGAVTANVERVDRFLRDDTFPGALHRWVGPDFDFTPAGLQARLRQQFGRDMARIDELLDRQVNSILHAPAFQKLEAAWRGLKHLVDRVPESTRVPIHVKVLNIPFDEVRRDIERSSEFDQSNLFRKIYTEGLDMPGADPFSVLIGDYQFNNGPNDLTILRGMSKIAAAAFAPFISAADPNLLDLRSFGELERPNSVDAMKRSIENELPYLKWRQFRETEDSRFVGLAIPHILLREPYRADTMRADGFHFRETSEKPDGSEFLWGNAAYAYAAVLVRSFHHSGWLADITGFRRGKEAGGLATELPTCSFDTDRRGLFPRPSTDVIITDAQERGLGELGFLPLCWCQDTNTAAFHGSQSVQKPKTYTDLKATVNARMSTMLRYMLCVARFAHNIKVIVRDMIGSTMTAEDVEYRIQKWLSHYTNQSNDLSPEDQARFPLRDAQITVFENERSPGSYRATVRLQPQFQLDNLVGHIVLKTR